MMAKSLMWSIEPKTFLKSIYVRYMSFAVSRASSKAAMIVWICLEMLCCGWIHYWLKYSSLCFSL